MRNVGQRTLIQLILLVGAILMALPFMWMVSSSLKHELHIFQFPPQIIPNPIRWLNYPEALANPNAMPFHIYVKNTVIIVFVREAAVLLSASFCAYGFARLRFVGRDIWFGIVLATMMVPYIVLMVPTYVLFTRLQWIDTFLPLTVPWFFGGGAFNIFLLRQFFRTIPEELADAARIDGCNEYAIYARILMPLAKPGLIAVAIFTFIDGWNDFMGPLLYLNSPENYTVALGLALFRAAVGGMGSAGGRSRWDWLMAASTAMVIPVILVFFALQRYFVKGVVMTGLKG